MPATIQCRHITFSNIKAILFDKDGTLENSQGFLYELGHRRAQLLDAQVPGTGRTLLAGFGLDGTSIDPTGLLAVGSHWENQVAAAAYVAATGRGWVDSMEMARQAFEQAENQLPHPSTPSPLFAGSLEVLQNLHQNGFKLGILSADSNERVQNFVRYYQLGCYIQLQMGVDNHGPSKPDPALFYQACQQLGVQPADTLMVGDAPTDMQMAKQAGAAGCIGICWSNPHAAGLELADIAIANLEEIQIVA
ncbi:HAD family hydrolase [Geitlerinema sp. PCC 9228]|jgi:phosphoglycolate phosphatase|uniref:HAD family hydrolase n=1 Tax=Geitlerinema sp. PCC 9228 TaxID=111611 RepID=UPI0008F9D595|nr:HAD family hydrolase [Geitlerinema sp. PCC 9228]